MMLRCWQCKSQQQQQNHGDPQKYQKKTQLLKKDFGSEELTPLIQTRMKNTQFSRTLPTFPLINLDDLEELVMIL